MIKIIQEDLKLVSGGGRSRNKKPFVSRVNLSAAAAYCELKKATAIFTGLTIEEINEKTSDALQIMFIAYFGLKDKDDRFVGVKENNTATMLRLFNDIRFYSL